MIGTIELTKPALNPEINMLQLILMGGWVYDIYFQYHNSMDEPTPTG
ncbi:MAG: hypothetical protein AAGJ08_20410 [Cyanobacteria bacterium P01_H01_bin.35]